jgi:acyl-coenzyme A thioesterase PaaI-like protein
VAVRGYPDAAQHVTPARIRLAEATRALAEALMSSDDASDAELEAAASTVDSVARSLRGDALGQPVARVRDERRFGDYLPRSPLVGIVSPLSPAATWTFDDGVLDLRVTFGAPYEGPPGYLHGGFVALTFDELLGMVTVLAGHGGLTGRLTVRYRRPTPLHRELRCTAWIEHREGRRVVARGTIHAGDELTAEGHGLFVSVRPPQAREYFGA